MGKKKIQKQKHTTYSKALNSKKKIKKNKNTFIIIKKKNVSLPM